MSQASDPKSRNRQPRPPKLRTACNQCNAAKVKCSGERDGCARCRTLHTTCVYVESRVGKVQGPRSRRGTSSLHQGVPREPASAAPQTASPDTLEANLSPETPRSNSFSSGPHPPAWSEPWDPSEDWRSGVQMPDGAFPGLHDLVNEGVLAFQANASPNGCGRASDSSSPGHASNDAGTIHCGSNLGAIMDVPSSTAETPAVSPNGLQIYHTGAMTSPSLSTSIPQNLGFALPPLPPVHTITAPPTQKPQHAGVSQQSIGDQASARLNNKCALACAHIIATLESYLLLELKALDLILEATRKATNELDKLVHLQKESRCGRCIMLFTAALSQVTELLEAGSKQLPDSGVGLSDRFPPGIQMGFMPSFGFGAFPLMAEEQLSLRFSLIRRECHHVGKVVQNVEALSTITTTTGIQEQRPLTGLDGLKQRLEEICHDPKHV
ncbi:hypothetical protein GGR50DRAFT_284546 [Xylaria sp. CBS 124048]|nr:hypothetical protein GGR50DRAFT_284546 [Xylaria sp. CBS 124048]